jgi:hypothetical protein
VTLLAVLLEQRFVPVAHHRTVFGFQRLYSVH